MISRPALGRRSGSGQDARAALDRARGHRHGARGGAMRNACRSLVGQARRTARARPRARSVGAGARDARGEWRQPPMPRSSGTSATRPATGLAMSMPRQPLRTTTPTTSTARCRLMVTATIKWRPPFRPSAAVQHCRGGGAERRVGLFSTERAHRHRHRHGRWTRAAQCAV